MLHMTLFCQVRGGYVVQLGSHQTIDRMAARKIGICLRAEPAIPAGMEITSLWLPMKQVHYTAPLSEPKY
jgi:hypothetical protein